jgi:hypothetical protein
MASFAQMDRELLIERTNAGLDAARKRGRFGGRKRSMTPRKIKVEAAKKLLAEGMPLRDVALNLKKSTGLRFSKLQERCRLERNRHKPKFYCSYLCGGCCWIYARIHWSWVRHADGSSFRNRFRARQYGRDRCSHGAGRNRTIVAFSAPVNRMAAYPSHEPGGSCFYARRLMDSDDRGYRSDGAGNCHGGADFCSFVDDGMEIQ